MKEIWGDRLANLLTGLALVATGGLILVFAAIAVNPAFPFNPYPPPIPSPSPRLSPTPTRGSSHPAVTPASSILPSPTPLWPATPTPTQEPTMPFSATVEPGAHQPLMDCSRPLLAGTVTDREGEPLMGYPLHVWGPGVDTIILSGSAPAYGPSGWEVAMSEEETEGVWFVQLHLYNIYRTHPPLSPIVRVALSETCPQAMVRFQEQPLR